MLKIWEETLLVTQEMLQIWSGRGKKSQQFVDVIYGAPPRLEAHAHVSWLWCGKGSKDKAGFARGKTLKVQQRVLCEARSL